LRDGFAAEREAALTRPQAREGFDTEVRLRRVTERALSALWNEEGDHVIADFELRDTRPAFDDHARSFVPENRGKLPRDLAFVGVQIGVAQAGRLHLHEDFASARAFELNFLDDERLIRAVHDGRADIQRHEDSFGDGESGRTLHHRLRVGLKPDLPASD
jgi:hypothetical protein